MNSRFYFASSRGGFRLSDREQQRGVILVISLIMMVVLLISAVALIRSFDTSLVLSGNLGFKRDLVNQGERGVRKVVTLLSGGGALVTDVSRQSDSIANNYSSSILATDAHGIPTMLIDDSQWTMTGADIQDTGTNVTIRYVIDRLCTASGAAGKANCAVSTLGSDKGGTSWVKKAGGTSLPVYRISIRVSGPRNTQTFIQTTVSL